MREHVRSRNFMNNVVGQKENYFKGLENNIKAERAQSGAGIKPIKYKDASG